MTDSFLKEGIISDEDKEIVRFGLESMEGNLQGIGLTLVVGICFNRVGEALLLVFGVYEHMLVFYGICVVIAGCVIWFLAPIANPSKELDAVEYKVYRRRTRIALGVETAIFVLALSIEWEMAVRSICMTFFIVCVSLLIGVAKYTISNKFRERDRKF